MLEKGNKRFTEGHTLVVTQGWPGVFIGWDPQWEVAMQGADSEARPLTFQFLLCHLLSVWNQANYLTFVCLSYFIHKMKLIVEFLWELNVSIQVKCLKLYMAQAKSLINVRYHYCH